jgi:hypothetical protein
VDIEINFIGAPDRLIRAADEILRSELRCTDRTRRAIRAVAKAYIDEADELKRAVGEFRSGTPAQLHTASPDETVELARSLLSVTLASRGMTEKVRGVAASYVDLGERNRKLFEEFLVRYPELVPPLT